MNIALIGYGRMGREIESVARAQGDEIVAVFDSENRVTAAALEGADVCIEFTRPDVALSSIYAAIEAKKDIVVGTTGWLEHLPAIREALRDSGLLHSANFSLGMNIFQRGRRQGRGTDAKCASVRPIHSGRASSPKRQTSPSGTAMTLAKIAFGKNRQEESRASREMHAGK